MKSKIFFILIAAAVLISGCSDKTVEVKEWVQYQDQFFRVSFNYPQGWIVVPEPTKIVASSSGEAAEKFFDRDPRKADGVQVVIASERSDTLQDYADYVSSFKALKVSEGYKVSEIEDAKLDGLDAKKVTFSGLVAENTRMKAVLIATLKDSTIYYVQYSAFNEMYEPYKPIFDTILTTIVLPQKVIIPKGVNPAIPVDQTEKYSDSFIQLEYPANFGSNGLSPKGDILSAVRFAGNREGMRNDCSIDIDIRPAKGLALQKVVEQNSKFFNPKSRGETNISGEKSIYLNYNPPRVKNIDSRVYFIVKNDKIYRIILNYYAPMRKDFLPPFEKVVASIRLK
ncbi:MAG: hypothetical protein JXA06_09630 [Bacteroidetes bacterium]|nr:hypothetical protein [Bacteroidota bacterium]